MCDENDKGLNRAAAIAFGNLLCEKKPIDWCEAQSRDPTARLVIKLLRAKAKPEDIPADELKNRDIDPDEVWRLLGQCELTTLPDRDNRKLLVRRPTRERASRPNGKPERDERLLGDEPVRVYVPLMLRPWVMIGQRGSTIGEGGDTTVLSPGRSPIQPLPGIGLYDPLHDWQACPEFIAFHQGGGQICSR